MVKRLFSLVVALAIAGAPAALEACQIACESMPVHAMTARDAHQDHRHHGSTATGTRHQAAATPHHVSPQAPPCDHEGEVNVATLAAARTFNIAALQVAVPSTAGVLVAGAPRIVLPRLSSLHDPLAIRLASPLRI